MLNVLMVTMALQGCGGDGGKEASDAAKTQMRTGDIPGAAVAFEKTAKENPESVDAASGAALSAMMRGDWAAAGHDAHKRGRRFVARGPELFDGALGAEGGNGHRWDVADERQIGAQRRRSSSASTRFVRTMCCRWWRRSRFGTSTIWTAFYQRGLRGNSHHSGSRVFVGP